MRVTDRHTDKLEECIIDLTTKENCVDRLLCTASLPIIVLTGMHINMDLCPVEDIIFVRLCIYGFSIFCFP